MRGRRRCVCFSLAKARVLIAQSSLSVHSAPRACLPSGVCHFFVRVVGQKSSTYAGVARWEAEQRCVSVLSEHACTAQCAARCLPLMAASPTPRARPDTRPDPQAVADRGSSRPLPRLPAQHDVKCAQITHSKARTLDEYCSDVLPSMCMGRPCTSLSTGNAYAFPVQCIGQCAICIRPWALALWTFRGNPRYFRHFCHFLKSMPPTEAGRGRTAYVTSTGSPQITRNPQALRSGGV